MVVVVSYHWSGRDHFDMALRAGRASLPSHGERATRV
jgi:hypothetical protein